MVLINRLPLREAAGALAAGVVEGDDGEERENLKK